MVIDALLAAILRGEQVDAAAVARHDPEAILLAASNHDIVPLVANGLAARADISDALQAMLRDRASQAVATDLLREVELRRFFAELEAASVDSLLIKGSQLAYSHYPRPDLRPRADTDVLIPTSAHGEVHEILTARLGYEAISRISREFMAGQRLYIKYRDGALVNAIDLQWQTATPHAVTGIPSYSELAATAVPLARLGSGARGPSDVHALLITCLHRSAHQPDTVHFKRLYDVDVVARGLTANQWGEFVSLAVDQKVAAICRRSLERTAYWFRTEIPLGLWSDTDGDRTAESSSRSSV